MVKELRKELGKHGGRPRIFAAALMILKGILVVRACLSYLRRIFEVGSPLRAQIEGEFGSGFRRPGRLLAQNVASVRAVYDAVSLDEVSVDLSNTGESLDLSWHRRGAAGQF